MSERIIRGISEYYSGKLMTHGPNHLGVDWNSKMSQYIRFQQLCRVLEINEFSILDYGCGYGELVNYLNKDKDSKFDYFGFDISEEMIKQASLAFKNLQNVSFDSKLNDQKFDYVMASGIFNVRLNLADNEDWLKYVITTINSFNDLSLKGFSFNLLTSYSDSEYMKDYLYYADPRLLFDYCMKNFSRNVALLHDYRLFEFTIIVKK